MVGGEWWMSKVGVDDGCQWWMVDVDGENSIIIVGGRHAMDLEEILKSKALVNIEAEYWSRTWIDFENRYFGQSGTDGVSRNAFIGIYFYVFRTFEGGVSHKKTCSIGVSLEYQYFK